MATTVVQCIVFCCTTKDTESTEACDDMLCTEQQVVARAIGWRLRSMRFTSVPSVSFVVQCITVLRKLNKKGQDQTA